MLQILVHVYVTNLVLVSASLFLFAFHVRVFSLVLRLCDEFSLRVLLISLSPFLQVWFLRLCDKFCFRVCVTSLIFPSVSSLVF